MALLLFFHVSSIYLTLGRDGVVLVLPAVPLDGFRKVLTTARRALPDMESDVPSRLNGVVPGSPEPLEPDAVLPLYKIKLSS